MPAPWTTWGLRVNPDRVNFLAHALLADDDDESIVGNLIADFAKGTRVSGFSAPIQRGIALHRAVDNFTDDHDVVRRSRRRVGPTFHLLSPVLVDVYYDHFLARRFDAFCPTPLPAFSQRVYGALLRHRDLLPPAWQQGLHRMVDADWLSSYADLERVGFVLERTASRMRRPGRMAEGLSALRAHYPELDGDFQEFFPQLQAHAAGLRGHHAVAGAS